MQIGKVDFIRKACLPAAICVTTASILMQWKLTQPFMAPRAGTTVQRWGAIVGPEFQFCLKTPQRITHQQGLVGVESEMSEFVQVVSALGERLGVILLQFPPSYTVENIDLLERFLPGVAGELRYSVEFRHPSWFMLPDGKNEPRAAEILRRYGVGWAATDYPNVPPRIYPTADFLYVRWIGTHGAYGLHTHERVDRTERLEAWGRALARKGEQAEALYGFFNNDYAGFAPATCNRFKYLLGLPATDLHPPQQGRLFYLPVCLATWTRWLISLPAWAAGSQPGSDL